VDAHIYYLKKASNSRKKLRVRGSVVVDDVAMATRIDRDRCSSETRGPIAAGRPAGRPAGRARGRERESHPRYVCTPLNNCGSFAQIIPGVSASAKVKYNNTAGEHVARVRARNASVSFSPLPAPRGAYGPRRVRVTRVRGRSLPRKRAYGTRDTYAEHTKRERAFKSPSNRKTPRGVG